MNIKKFNIHKPFGNINWIVLLIIATSFLIRMLYVYHPFWGLEYEDSYIFSTVSRSINTNYDFDYDTFYTKTGVFGSIADEHKMETISGHNIFFPLLLAAINEIIGYHPTNVLITNSILSLITIFFTLKTFFLISPGRMKLIWFGLIYATIPFLTIYNSSGLSETFSSVFLSGTVYFAFKTKNTGYRKYHYICLYGIFLTLAIFVKRDNLVLMAIPCLELLNAITFKKKKTIYLQLSILICLVFLIITSNLVFDVGRTIKDEFSDVGAAPFSLTYLSKILPVFLTSLFNQDFFGFGGILFLVAFFLLIKKMDSYSMILLSVTLGYIFIYSFHYRSYYFVNNNQAVKTIDTLRYYTNFFPIALTFACYTLSYFVKGFFAKKKIILIHVACSAIVFLNIYYLIRLREDLSNIEWKERFLPVTNVLKTVKLNDIIITDRPIVFKLFCSNKQFIVDVAQIGKEEQIQIDSLKKTREVFIMKDEETDNRYENKNRFFKKNSFEFVKRLSIHYTLYKLR